MAGTATAARAHFLSSAPGIGSLVSCRNMNGVKHSRQCRRYERAHHCTDRNHCAQCKSRNIGAAINCVPVDRTTDVCEQRGHSERVIRPEIPRPPRHMKTSGCKPEIGVEAEKGSSQQHCQNMQHDERSQIKPRTRLQPGDHSAPGAPASNGHLNSRDNLRCEQEDHQRLSDRVAVERPHRMHECNVPTLPSQADEMIGNVENYEKTQHDCRGEMISAQGP